jgi:hypothetical protein
MKEGRGKEGKIEEGVKEAGKAGRSQKMAGKEAGRRQGRREKAEPGWRQGGGEAGKEGESLPNFFFLVPCDPPGGPWYLPQRCLENLCNRFCRFIELGTFFFSWREKTRRKTILEFSRKLSYGILG